MAHIKTIDRAEHCSGSPSVLRSRRFFLFCRFIMLLPFLICSGRAGQISRIDVFDKAGNNLLFVTFSYDSLNRNTGRSVFAADSTFLRITKFVCDGTGAVVREVSFDYNGDTLFTTKLSGSGSSRTFSVSDQFGLDQLGGPMTLAESSSGNYTVTQSGTSLQYREQYVFARDSTLSRINLYDQSNTLIYYAAVTAITPITFSHALYPRAAVLVTPAKNGKLMMRLPLVKSAVVRMTIYDLAGREVSVPVQKKFPAGDLHIVAPADASNGKPLAAGAYIVRVTVDNIVCFNAVRIMLQR